MRHFFSNVSRLLQGSIAGQLIAFAALPILARLYNSHDLGIAQAVLSILNILIIVSALRLEVAILYVPSEKLENLMRCGWWLCVFTSSIALIVTSIITLIRIDWSDAHRVAALLLPLVGLFSGWNLLLGYFALRLKAFSASSNVKIVQSLAYSSSAASLGYWRPSSVSLLLAEIFSRFSSNYFIVRSLRLEQKYFKWPGFKILKTVLKSHRELVSLGLGGALVNTAGSAFTSVMLLGLFNASEAGQYAMLERFIGMPVGLIAATVSQVFMAQLSSAVSTNNHEESLNTFRKLLKIQTIAGLAIVLVLLFLAPQLIVFVLGESWQRSSEMLQPLSLLYFFSFIVGPINMTLTIIYRQRLQLMWDCTRFILVNSTWFGVWYFSININSALWLYALSASISYLIYIIITNQALRTFVRAPQNGELC